MLDAGDGPVLWLRGVRDHGFRFSFEACALLRGPRSSQIAVKHLNRVGIVEGGRREWKDTGRRDRRLGRVARCRLPRAAPPRLAKKKLKKMNVKFIHDLPRLLYLDLEYAEVMVV